MLESIRTFFYYYFIFFESGFRIVFRHISIVKFVKHLSDEVLLSFS